MATNFTTIGNRTIGRGYAQKFLTPRSVEDWAAQDESYAERGYVLCSFGDGRYVSPNFIRVMPDGEKIALCPDRQGQHPMRVGPTAHEAILNAYRSAQPVFQQGQEVTVDQVREVLGDKHEDPIMLLRDAIDQGLIQRRQDAAETATEAREDANVEQDAPAPTEPPERTADEIRAEVKAEDEAKRGKDGLTPQERMARARAAKAEKAKVSATA